MNLLKYAARRIRQFLLAPLLEFQGRSADVSQIHLQQWYTYLLRTNGPLPPFRDTGFSVYSESDEDGCLLFIFSLIGFTNRKLVDLGAAGGVNGSNTANLMINHRFHGLLVDGDASRVAKGREYYACNPHTRLFPPIFVHSWITRDNVNALLESHGFAGEIDLLSVDIDGVDYWLLEALTTKPRVIVLEYNSVLGPDRSITIPYSDTFNAYQGHTSGGTPNYLGASLSAFVKLAKAKGYRLVGCNRYGYNAFFVQEGLAESQIPEIPIEECFRGKNHVEHEEKFRAVADREWVEV